MTGDTLAVVEAAAHDLQSLRQSEHFYQFPELINCTPRLALASWLIPVIYIAGKLGVVLVTSVLGKIIQISITFFLQIWFCAAIVGVIISKLGMFL